MILIFSHLGNDGQSLAIEKALNKATKVKVVIIKTHSKKIRNIELNLLLGNLYFKFGKRNNYEKVNAIIYSTHPRIDSITEIPNSILFLNEYRYRMSYLLEEISIISQGKIQFPSTLQNIRRAESKFLITQIQNESRYFSDINSIKISRNIEKNLFIKPIGYPAVVTNKSGNNEEFIITRLGEKTKMEYKKNIPFYQMDHIFSLKHKRYFISESFQAGVYLDLNGANRKEDLREYDFRDIVWKSFILDEVERDELLSLNKKFGVSWSTPEILECKEGKKYLIDINPCGDWEGFFCHENKEKIIQAIVYTITDNLI